MLSRNCKGRAVRVCGIAALAVLGLGAMSWPGEVMAWTGQPLAYVTNPNDNTVSVIDTGDNSVVDTVQVLNNPFGIAVAPDGKRVYVLNAISNNVSVIETVNETNTPVATIPVGNEPTGVAVTPDGTRAYVTNLASNNVSVINTANNDVMTTVAVGTNPLGIAITPDGKHVYVVNSNSGGPGSVSVIDTATNKVVYTIIPAANDTEHITITPDGTCAYLSSGFGSLLVIDTTTNQVMTTILTGQGLNSLARIIHGSHWLAARWRHRGAIFRGVADARSGVWGCAEGFVRGHTAPSATAAVWRCDQRDRQSRPDKGRRWAARP